MSSEYKFNCELIGIIDIIRSMKDESKEEKLQIAEVCGKLIAESSKDHPKLDMIDTTIFNVVQARLMKVTLKITETSMELHSPFNLVTSHLLKQVSIVAALVTYPGYLVYVGRCQKRNKRVAIIVNSETHEIATKIKEQFVISRARHLKSLNLIPDTSKEEEKYKEVNKEEFIIPKRPDIDEEEGEEIYDNEDQRVREYDTTIISDPSLSVQSRSQQVDDFYESGYENPEDYSSTPQADDNIYYSEPNTEYEEFEYYE